MSAAKKLSGLYHKVLRHGVLCGAFLTAGTGAGVYGIEAALNDHPLHDKAPVTDVALHAAAVDKLAGDVAAVFAAESKIQFNAQTRHVEDGNDIGKVADLGTDLWEERKCGCIDDDVAALGKSIANFRRDVLLNTALSEREVSAYVKVVDDNVGAVESAFYLPVLTDSALSYRDEVRAEYNLPEDPAKAPSWTAEDMAKIIEAKGEANLGKAIGPAFDSVPFSAVGWGLLLAGLRKRARKESGADKKAGPGNKGAPKPGPDPGSDPGPKPDAPPFKPARLPGQLKL